MAEETPQKQQFGDWVKEVQDALGEDHKLSAEDQTLLGDPFHSGMTPRAAAMHVFKGTHRFQ